MPNKTRALLLLLGTGVGLVAGLWAVGTLLEKAEAGQPLAVDRVVTEALRGWGGDRWQGMMLQITALGSKTVLTLVTLLAVLGLALGGRRLIAMKVAIAGAGSGLLTLVVKNLVERPRPGIVPWFDEFVGASHSFPSGHSLSSMAIYGSLGLLLSRLAPTRPAAIFTRAMGFGLPVLVGISRIYLGVHYPTDVLLGLLAGLVWALVLWRTLQALESRVD